MIEQTKNYVEEKYTIENGYKHNAKVRAHDNCLQTGESYSDDWEKPESGSVLDSWSHRSLVQNLGYTHVSLTIWLKILHSKSFVFDLSGCSFDY